MPRVLYLTVHRPDRSPSQRFRFEQYIDFLAEHGFEYDFAWLLSQEDDRRFYQQGGISIKGLIVLKSVAKRLLDIFRRNRYDIVFVQREAIMLGTAFFERMLSKGRARFIYDFDDSIWLQNVSKANRRFVWLKDPDKTAKLIAMADLVFAGNRYLHDYAIGYNERVEIVPTTINTEEYQSESCSRREWPVCIGWSGSLTTIQHFEFAVPFLLKLKQRYGDRIAFKVIGDGTYHNETLGIQGLPWIKEDEIRELGSMDIGLMPLPDDEWASGKCGLKGLQYMALGVATIMSPVGVNSEIIHDGQNGFLAANEEAWIDRIGRLIEDAELRRRLGIAGRQTVEERYSVRSHRDRYLKLFESLV